MKQREHALAVEIASRGFKVFYVEDMPSFAYILRAFMRRLFYKKGIEEPKNNNRLLPERLSVVTPPIIPTFFRNSLSPLVDKIIFKIWFRSRFKNIDWNKTIVMVMFSYWCDGFLNHKKYPAKYFIYDICDAPEVQGNSQRGLRRILRGEEKLIRIADLITFSADTMRKRVDNLFSEKKTLFLPNAVHQHFLEMADIAQKNGSEKVIGYIGSLEERWIDIPLIKKIAEVFVDFEIAIIGPVSMKQNILFSSCSNIKLYGVKTHEESSDIIRKFDIGIIPFINNSVTNVVNPLKLYEYCALGIPIVAMRTKELEQYSHLVDLADTHEEFLQLIEKNINSNDSQKRNQRIEFAKQNTWKHRVDGLLETISMLEK
ncbi:MAG: hypothetical protein H3C35_12185 [Bacteroidetes bacterium]|nr:hypothetical protein [Bacteroidota bacterium]